MRPDFSKFDSIPKGFKCDVCSRRWPPMHENGKYYICTCGNKKVKSFWYKVFEKAPEEMTVTQASKVIGAAAQGNTLRRAIYEGRLTSIGRKMRADGKEGHRDHVVTRDALIEYYLRYFSHQKAKRKPGGNGKTGK